MRIDAERNASNYSLTLELLLILNQPGNHACMQHKVDERAQRLETGHHSRLRRKAQCHKAKERIIQQRTWRYIRSTWKQDTAQDYGAKLNARKLKNA